MSGIRIEALTGPRLKAHLPDVARLRIEVFRDFPYLYDGNLDYEARYIASFAASPNALVVAAFDGDVVVGASTAAPMATQIAEVTAPFRARGDDLSRIFYFGESVLKSAYRGQYVPLWAFWRRRGFHATCGLMGQLSWKEIGADEETLKPMQFWTKRLS